MVPRSATLAQKPVIDVLEESRFVVLIFVSPNKEAQ
jgi:hypothetical protein